MRKLLISLTAVVLMVPAVFSQGAGDTESLVSADLYAFVKTGRITELLKSINYAVYNLMDEEERSSVLMQRDDFKNRTGIDYLNEASLKSNGIDTSRPVSMAFFQDDNNRDVYLLFLPVFNEKEFPLKFNEFRKRNIGDTGNYTVPLKGAYEGITIYQHSDDVFTAAFNGYFLIGSTAEIVIQAIKLKNANTGSLVLDNNYREYMAGINKNADLNIYLSSMVLAPLDNMFGSGPEEGNADKGTSLSTAVKYISLGIALEGNAIKIKSLMKIKGGNPHMDMLLDLLQPGLQKHAVYSASADMNMVLGLNLSAMVNFCKKSNSGCDSYLAMRDQFNKGTGIDFEKEFVPNFTGVVNVVMSGDSGEKEGEMALFLPMIDAKKTEAIWSRLKKTMQDMYGPKKMFGDEKGAAKKMFWIMDDKQKKFFFAFDAKGLYAGDSPDMIKTVSGGQPLDKVSGGASFGKMLNDKTVMFITGRRFDVLQNALSLLNITNGVDEGVLAEGGSDGNTDSAGTKQSGPARGEPVSDIKEIRLKSDRTADGITFDMELELKGK